MHLWPTLRIRESFAQAYLSKLEWNLERIKRSKQETSSSSSFSSADQPLLLASKSQSQSQSQSQSEEKGASKLITKVLALAGDILVLLTCCCCCFCCEARMCDHDFISTRTMKKGL